MEFRRVLFRSVGIIFIDANGRAFGRMELPPEVCGGKPCIKGTRIWVALVLDFLAGGMTELELLTEYPQLTHQDVLAAIAYGAEMSRERILPIPLGNVA